MKLTQFVEDVVIHHIEQYIRWHVAPAFWKKFENTDDSQQGFELFKSAVDALYTSLTEFLPSLKRLEYMKQDNMCSKSNTGNDIRSRFKLIVRATLLSQLPLCHECIIEHFYKIAFNVFCNSDNSSQGKSLILITDFCSFSSKYIVLYNCECVFKADGEDTSLSEIQCIGCGQEVEKCQCQMVVYMFHETNRKLIELELLERLVGNVLTSLIHIRIENHVIRSCDKTFDVSQLIPLENVRCIVVVRDDIYYICIYMYILQ